MILLLHRYLGIGLGALMVMWCLSGVVMMYVGYPALDEGARLAHLEPLAWAGCCRWAESRVEPPDADGAQVEMLGGRPVLFLAAEQLRPIDLRSGEKIDGISAGLAAGVAKRFGAPARRGAVRLLGLIDHDQWTVSGEFNDVRPLYRFALGDAAGTQLYVSSISGRAVQATTARERFWNWLGAIPHWLYFTELRRHAWLWSQVLIYSSLLGCFLAGVGIYLGVRQMLAQPAGHFSPYAGFNLWHHLAGLLFGIFALTWVLSGLLSMNPWGWLEGAGGGAQSARIHGAPLTLPALGAALQSLADAKPESVAVESVPLDGKPYFIATSAGGARQRFDAGGRTAPLNGQELKFLAKTLGAPAPDGPELLDIEDAFYFSHHRQLVPLPVYRVIAASGTRYYLDPLSGMLRAKFDAQAQAYRWLHEGLHRLDFAAPLRARPQWDALMLLLMGGVTAVCVTGVCLGYRRLTRRAGSLQAAKW
ncbi:MAG TPA: hypothetical protein VHW71_12915 [Steroidobacteraceae bacterium]|nr:hypothetical protein [Steroidobacteraceae bacterium]